MYLIYVFEVLIHQYQNFYKIFKLTPYSYLYTYRLPNTNFYPTVKLLQKNKKDC